MAVESHQLLWRAGRLRQARVLCQFHTVSSKRNRESNDKSSRIDRNLRELVKSENREWEITYGSRSSFSSHSPDCCFLLLLSLSLLFIRRYLYVMSASIWYLDPSLLDISSKMWTRQGQSKKLIVIWALEWSLVHILAPLYYPPSPPKCECHISMLPSMFQTT